MRDYMRIMENNQVDTGKLQIQVQSSVRNVPIQDARIQISYTGNPTQTIEEVVTDESGQSPGKAFFQSHQAGHRRDIGLSHSPG